MFRREWNHGTKRESLMAGEESWRSPEGRASDGPKGVEPRHKTRESLMAWEESWRAWRECWLLPKAQRVTWWWPEESWRLPAQTGHDNSRRHWLRKHEEKADDGSRSENRQ